jgi:hypothetical protein
MVFKVKLQAGDSAPMCPRDRLTAGHTDTPDREPQVLVFLTLPEQKLEMLLQAWLYSYSISS